MIYEASLQSIIGATLNRAASRRPDRSTAVMSVVLSLAPAATPCAWFLRPSRAKSIQRGDPIW